MYMQWPGLHYCIVWGQKQLTWSSPLHHLTIGGPFLRACYQATEARWQNMYCIGRYGHSYIYQGVPPCSYPLHSFLHRNLHTYMYMYNAKPMPKLPKLILSHHILCKTWYTTWSTGMITTCRPTMYLHVHVEKHRLYYKATSHVFIQTKRKYQWLWNIILIVSNHIQEEEKLSRQEIYCGFWYISTALSSAILPPPLWPIVA